MIPKSAQRFSDTIMLNESRKIIPLQRQRFASLDEMLPDAGAEHVDRDDRCDDNDDLRGRFGVLEAADAFVKRLTDSSRAHYAERRCGAHIGLEPVERK